jgi:hypothetical protein
MKKAIIGVVAVSAVVGVGLLGRRAGQAMREHCEQMVGQFGHRREAVGKT